MDESAALDALAGLVGALNSNFSEYGVCCFVVDQHSGTGACGDAAHWLEFRVAGTLFYCDKHVEQRPDPKLVQQLPHAQALRVAQRVLKEVGRG